MKINLTHKTPLGETLICRNGVWATGNTTTTYPSMEHLQARCEMKISFFPKMLDPDENTQTHTSISASLIFPCQTEGDSDMSN